MKDVLGYARALETSEAEACVIESTMEHVNKLHINHSKTTASRTMSTEPKQRQNNICGRCGYTYPHKNSCPADGHICNSCGKLNHFAKMCRSQPKSAQSYHEPKQKQYKKYKKYTGKQYRQPSTSTKPNVHQIKAAPNTNSSDSDIDYVYQVGNLESSHTLPRITVAINGKAADILVDSGSSVDLLDRVAYASVGSNLDLKPTSKKIIAYGSKEPLPIIGKINADVVFGKKISYSTFYVVDGDYGSILGCSTSIELGLLSVVNSTMTYTTTHPIVSRYPELFDGIGKFKGQKIKLQSTQLFNQ